MNINVHKFGGASLANASLINNVAHIVSQQKTPCIIVVSAMGKTTNALEDVVKSAYYQKDDPKKYLEKVKNYHSEIIDELFKSYDYQKTDELKNLLNPYWQQIENYIQHPVTYPYGQFYDQIVSVGELISSHIVSEYFNTIGLYNTWTDIRKIIITDTQWRSANVNIQASEINFQNIIIPQISEHSIIITQGFIGSTSNGYTTTLGREGSDYTAALIANFSDTKNICIWKDVEGVLNADPRYFKNVQKIDELSYYDAIEMTYYGATVLHPKTIKPLQNKNIPLKVKSFIHPESSGTLIHQSPHTARITTYSYLPNQILISLQSIDYSFFAETHIYQVFEIINNYNIKINLMQNTALNFSICVTNDPTQIPAFISSLQKHFKVLYNENVSILTIRNYQPSFLSSIIKNKQILLEQRSRHNVQFVMSEG